MKLQFTRDFNGYRKGKVIDVPENTGYLKLWLRRGLVEVLPQVETTTDMPQQKRKRTKIERAVKNYGDN